MTVQELIASAQTVDVSTHRLAEDALPGLNLSARRGRGTDFDELREYVPGDDVRDLDWKVSSRMGRPFVRRHREEREFGVMLVVDVSASSGFGSANRSKRQYAAEAGATLAVSAARRGSKVGLILFTDRVELHLPPRKGRSHLLRVVREMVSFEPQGWSTNIGGALAALNHSLRRRSLVLLLSDFLEDASASEAGLARHPLTQELGIARARHDVVCIQIHDPCEAALPDVGWLTLEDAETAELVEIATGNRSVRDQYANRQARRLDDLDRVFDHVGIDHLRLRTDEPCAPPLQRFFELRRRRRP